MLKEFGIQCGYPCSYPRSEPTQNVVETDEICQSLVNYDIYYFSKHLHQANYTVLTSTLGEKDDGGPHALRLQLPSHKHQLYNIHNNIPP